MVVTKGLTYIDLNRPVALNTTFVTTTYLKVNEKQGAKGESYSEK